MRCTPLRMPSPSDATAGASSRSGTTLARIQCGPATGAVKRSLVDPVQRRSSACAPAGGAARTVDTPGMRAGVPSYPLGSERSVLATAPALSQRPLGLSSTW